MSEFHKTGVVTWFRLDAKGPAMRVLSVSAITITSTNPAALAAFYRERLGLPLERSSHGPMQEHWEGWLRESVDAGVHLAILKGRSGSPDAGGVAMTFRVRDIVATTSELESYGLEPVHKIADIGGGKRVVSFRDPDGNVFRLLELTLP